MATAVRQMMRDLTEPVRMGGASATHELLDDWWAARVAKRFAQLTHHAGVDPQRRDHAEWCPRDEAGSVGGDALI
jgi:hypothetical protein